MTRRITFEVDKDINNPLAVSFYGSQHVNSIDKLDTLSGLNINMTTSLFWYSMRKELRCIESNRPNNYINVISYAATIVTSVE